MATRGYPPTASCTGQKNTRKRPGRTSRSSRRNPRTNQGRSHDHQSEDGESQAERDPQVPVLLEGSPRGEELPTILAHRDATATKKLRATPRTGAHENLPTVRKSFMQPSHLRGYFLPILHDY